MKKVFLAMVVTGALMLPAAAFSADRPSCCTPDAQCMQQGTHQHQHMAPVAKEKFKTQVPQVQDIQPRAND